MSEHELWNELGNLYFMSGAYDQASYAYQRSIEMDPGFGRPYSNLAVTYVQQGKYDEAIDLYRTSIELLADKQEKAISWNRLGTVYRHLKDYSKAVIAFQEADELDPRNTMEFPAGPDIRQQPAHAPSRVSNVEPHAVEQKQAEPETAWWDVVESPTIVPQLEENTESQSPDDEGSSWTATDLSQYQQDILEMPEIGALTTWGDADFDEDIGARSPLDAEPELYIPEPDNDRRIAWLPVPEEEPRSDVAFHVPAFFEQVEPEAETSPEWNKPVCYHVVDSIDCELLLLATASTPRIAERTDLISNKQDSSLQSVETQDVDVDVQDRPASDFTLATREYETETLLEREPTVEAAPAPKAFDAPTAFEQPSTVELAIEAPGLQPDHDATGTFSLIEEESLLDESAALQPGFGKQSSLPPIKTELASAEVVSVERDPDEMRDIEKGIAKFKRVVQLNPRNGHAWDALGTLYKSAGKYMDAITAYQQAISNDPTRSLYHHHLGLVYACEGRDEDAIGAFQRVIEIDPDYSLAHATLGGYYRKLGLEELAQKHIGKAMKNIFDSENEYNRACLEAICGNADQAIELLGVALKNKQTYVDWILRDPDLDFIRQDPRFKQLISDYTR
jgi:tetratricopeptide (TPR) repeat protein